MRAEPNNDVLTVGRPAGEHEDAAWPGDLTTPMVKHIRKIRGGRRRRASCIRKGKRQSHFRALDSRCHAIGERPDGPQSSPGAFGQQGRGRARQRAPVDAKALGVVLERLELPANLSKKHLRYLENYPRGGTFEIADVSAIPRNGTDSSTSAGGVWSYHGSTRRPETSGHG